MYNTVRWYLTRGNVNWTTEKAEGIREVSAVVAAGTGILINGVGQLLARRFDSLSLLHDAFITWYCTLLLLGSPMPFFPGDGLFCRISAKARSYMFLLVAISSAWRIGMLIPAMFMYIDLESPSTEYLDDIELNGRSKCIRGWTMAGMSALCVLGIVLG